MRVLTPSKKKKQKKICLQVEHPYGKKQEDARGNFHCRPAPWYSVNAKKMWILSTAIKAGPLV